MTQRGIQHVALRVTDATEAAVFYRDILGMMEVPRPDPAPVPGAWLDAGGQQVHLIQDDGPIGTPHFAITVDDLASTVASIRERGVAVYEVDHLPGAGYQAFVRDPSGNVIELNQPEASTLGPLATRVRDCGHWMTTYPALGASPTRASFVGSVPDPRSAYGQR